MPRFPRALKVSIIACSVPGAIIALVATVGAWWHWGGLNFSNPLYYATLAVAAWCPVSKIAVCRLWRRAGHGLQLGVGGVQRLTVARLPPTQSR